MSSSSLFGSRIFSLLFAATVFAAAAGCSGSPDAGEGDDEDDATAESESELKSGCVQSNFNCPLPNHPYDDKDRNRFFTQTGNIKWKVPAGTQAVDGLGNAVGTITSSVIEINYGQRKTIKGKRHVFGFRYTTGANVATSAWVLESAVVGDTSKMPSVDHGDPGRGDERRYIITGGNPAKYKDGQGRDYKISKAGTGNLEANDYLVRPSRVVHMLYSVPGFQIGGVATDTFRVDKNIEFVRTKGVNSIAVPTYSATGAPGPTMKFIYGRVGRRWGWIAYDALRPI